MQVRDGMSPMVLTIGPGHTLRDAARLMSERHVGAAVVIDPDGSGPGPGAPAAIRYAIESSPGVSEARTANPSIAELANGGRSTRERAGSRSTR